MSGAGIGAAPRIGNVTWKASTRLVCQRICTRTSGSWRVRVTSAINSRSSSLRSAQLVFSACQTLGRSSTRLRSCWRWVSSSCKGELLEEAMVIDVQLLLFLQVSFPRLFQGAGYQAIVRVDLFVAAFGQADGITSGFQAEGPLLFEERLLAVDFFQNGQTEFDLCRGQGCQHSRGHRLIHFPAWACSDR